VDIQSPDGNIYHSRTIAGTGRTTTRLGALGHAGWHILRVLDIRTGATLALEGFEVVPGPPQVRILDARPVTFYPTVRDRYRDKVTVRYTLDERASVNLEIRNSNGKRVFTTDAGTARPGTRTATWNGMTNPGQWATPGKYRVVVHVRTEDGRRASDSVRVNATSDIVTRHASDSWRGTETDRRGRRGNCYFRAYSGELTLDCWAGVFARAEYDFRIPASAKNLRFTVRGEHNCCTSGRFSATGKKVGPRRYTVAVQVTNWRSYTVRHVELRYAYQQRR